MNTFIKNKFFYLLLLSTPYTISGAIKINDQDLNTVITPDQILVYTNSSDNNIALSIKDNNIQLGSVQLNNTAQALAYFNELLDQKAVLYQNISKDAVHLVSGQSITINGAYISGNNQVVVNARTSLEIIDAILKSKEIIFCGSDLKFDRCFIDTDVLQIESTAPESLCKIIRFTFNKSINNIPHCIQGQLNFAKNETDTVLFAVGAEKLEILFAPQAFEKSE